MFIDSYSKWIRQKCYQFFINKKLKKIFYIFTCILPNYVPHEITKEFWKNSHFENITAGFILRSQNLLWWNTPWKDAFSGMTFFIFTNIAPMIVIVLTKCSLCCIFCFHESMFQWQIKDISHRSEFWHLRRKSVDIFSKRLFFQNSLVISWGT